MRFEDDSGDPMITAITFAISSFCLALLVFAFSTCGLWPTGMLGRRQRGHLKIIHFFALQLIIALTYVYTNGFVRPEAEELFLPLTVACWCVEVLWWHWVARRADTVGKSFYVLMYITSTVLFAFIAPAMIVVQVALMLNEEGLRSLFHITVYNVSPIVAVHTLVLTSLFLMVFWTTNRFVSFANGSLWLRAT